MMRGSCVIAAAALLLYEHSLVKPHDLRRLDAAFFTMNGVISIAFFVFVLAERLQRAFAVDALADAALR